MRSAAGAIQFGCEGQADSRTCALDADRKCPTQDQALKSTELCPRDREAQFQQAAKCEWKRRLAHCVR